MLTFFENLKTFFEKPVVQVVSTLIGTALLFVIAAVVIYYIRIDLKEQGEVKTSSTRNIAILAIMAALSTLAMSLGFPIIPAVPFLKVEFSVLFIFLVFIWFDFKSAIIVSVITNIIHALISDSVILFLDEGINFLATMIFLIPFVIAFRKYCLGGRSKEVSCELNLPVKRLILTGIISVLITAFVMIIINLVVIIPLYNKMLGGAIDGLLKGIHDNKYIAVLISFGPFNLIHWGLVAILIVIFGPRLVKIRHKFIK